MDALPQLAAGFVRLEVRFRLAAGVAPTPGDLVRASGCHPDELGPIMVAGVNAVVDIRSEAVAKARDGLAVLGVVKVADWNFRWVRLAVGRNHGLTIGQLRKVMTAAAALPMGRFNINNTHTMVGVRDDKVAGLLEKLAEMRINGTGVRPEVVTGTAARALGNPSFNPGA